MRKIIILAFVFLTGVSSLVYSQEKTKKELLMESFEQVWQTVNETHYDTTFGGVDWNAVHEKYKPLVAAISDEEDFYPLINKMLKELKLSHNSVFPKRIKKKSAPQGAEAGLNLRMIDGEAVITYVKNDYPADNANLKPGYIVTSVNGRPIKSIVEECEKEVSSGIYEELNQGRLLRKLSEPFMGGVGETVSIGLLDENRKEKTVKLSLKEKTGKSILSDLMPPFYVDFEAKRLRGNIGYIKFNVFIPPVHKEFEKAIDGMTDVKGLIIDIRNSPGGSHVVGELVAGRLVHDKTLFSVFENRDNIDSVYIPLDKSIHKPLTNNVYDGPVVVLIDEYNASASERFSACLQSIGRAVVIGKRSMGSVGPSQLMELANGSTFMHLVALSKTPDGKILEGVGVSPDVEVSLVRENLLQGIDDQIEAAIDYVLKQ